MVRFVAFPARPLERDFYLEICTELCYYKYNLTKHCNKSHLYKQIK